MPGILRDSALVAILMALAAAATAAEPFVWPQPLTLKQALEFADERHPDMRTAQAHLDRAQSELRLAGSATDLTSNLVAQARWIDPPALDPDQSSDDHRLSVYLRKRLYDFGRTGAAVAAAEMDLDAQQALYGEALNQYRLEVMAQFFDVLLADMRFARDDEAMAIAFISFDRAQKRNELGQVSDIVLREAQSDYQRVRRERYSSQALQRTTRARLAGSLNNPQRLPSELAPLPVMYAERPLPEYEASFVLLEERNPVLRALQAQLVGAQERVRSARALRSPTLNGEVEVSEYSRERGSNDRWRAGVVLDVPLWTGGGVDALVARRQADLRLQEAALERKRLELRQSLMEVWLELETLQAAMQEMKALVDYRDLYLDRSRALYEMEVRTDLGDAMVRISQARLQLHEVEFKARLAWARWNTLLGYPVDEMEESPK